MDEIKKPTEITEEDLKKINGGADGQYQFTCPHCGGHEIFLDVRTPRCASCYNVVYLY